MHYHQARDARAVSLWQEQVRAARRMAAKESSSNYGADAKFCCEKSRRMAARQRRARTRAGDGECM
jgi:hypothetical protein